MVHDLEVKALAHPVSCGVVKHYGLLLRAVADHMTVAQVRPD